MWNVYFLDKGFKCVLCSFYENLNSRAADLGRQVFSCNGLYISNELWYNHMYKLDLSDYIIEDFKQVPKFIKIRVSW